MNDSVGWEYSVLLATTFKEFLNELQTTEYVRNSGIDYNIIQKISDLLAEIREKAFKLDDPEYFEDYEESKALEKILY